MRVPSPLHGLLLPAVLCSASLALAQAPAASVKPPDQILLKDYKPVSIHRVPVTTVAKARYPAIDMHSHPWAKTPEDVDRWVKVMDEVGVEKTVLLTGAHGAEFDRLALLYSRHPTRFELWCGFDYTGHDQPGYGKAAVAELERCVRKGARGVGEEGDKGLGMGFGEARGCTSTTRGMAPLLDRCADLGIPVNIHVADPIWMYQKMDETNDGMMNAVVWRLDDKPGIVDHSGMIEKLERTVRRHPRTTFVACHLANLDYDLERLGGLLDRLPNLYADISARYAETAVTPRAAARFIACTRTASSTARTWAPTRTCTAHLPHPRDARRALLRPDLRVPLELLRLRARGPGPGEALPGERAARWRGGRRAPCRETGARRE